MPLRLYNTLTRQKEIFAPIDSANVRLYACGPTVYDHLHIGNGRMLIVFDVLFRLLRREYGENNITYVRNITDIDDKINARAAERGVDIRVLTDEMTKVFHEDAKALGCLAPTVEPRATDHIAEMTALIDKLIAKGHAYVAEGHVLFDVPSMPAYGTLSKRPLDEMIAGARVEVAPYKRSPMDFVLWKPSTPGSGPGAGWESPWGRGRPGWHIECSAMSWKHLGESFDIHGGGIDLLFPHHENEMAQSCSAFGHDVMAKVWMHNGHLQVEGEKMAKSLGNFVTIRELLRTDKFGGRSWPGEVLRLAILMTHYRQPMDLTAERLREADARHSIWGSLVSQLSLFDSRRAPSRELVEILSDDLNTPEAIAYLTRQENFARSSREATRQFGADICFLGTAPFRSVQEFIDMSDEELARWRSEMESVAQTAQAKLEILGDFASDTIRTFELVRRGGDPTAVSDLLSARAVARKNKNFAESDRIRDELDAMGIALKDNKDGTTTWEVKR